MDKNGFVIPLWQLFWCIYDAVFIYVHDGVCRYAHDGVFVLSPLSLPEFLQMPYAFCVPQWGTYIPHCGMYVPHCGMYVPHSGI